MADELVIDQWSGLDNKSLDAVSDLPKYYSTDQQRRLTAYRAYAAYRETVSRNFLPEGSIHDVDELQEFGDAAVLIARVATAVIGDEPLISVEGAEQELPDAPDIRPFPEEPAETATSEEKAVRDAVFAAVVARWTEDSTDALTDWEELGAEIPKLRRRQELLRDWAEKDRFIPKARENEEEHIVGLGDGVMVIGWVAKARRPTVEIAKPDTYMPVLAPGASSEFPSRVDLLWQFAEIIDEEEKILVRRITYELVPVEEAAGEGQPVVPIVYESGEEEEPVQTHVCLLSNGVWLLDDFPDRTDGDAGTPLRWEKIAVEADDTEDELIDLDRYNTGWDFIPVVHFPNTDASSGHFGRSILARLIQLLDELNGADTDISLSSRRAARPPVVIDGLPAGTDTVDLSPGVGISGKSVHTIEMAQNLEKLLQYLKDLLRRLSVNGQVPEGLLGRVDASEVPSGLALTLSFTPFVQLINGLRQARTAKYPLVLKFVQRIAIQQGAPGYEDDPVVYPAEIEFGSFMPQDLVEITSVLSQLVSGNILSRRSAIVQLQARGLAIDDTTAELAAINAVDGVTADLMTSATENPKYAAAFLGIEGFEAATPEGSLDPEGGVDPVEGAGGGIPPLS